MEEAHSCLVEGVHAAHSRIGGTGKHLRTRWFWLFYSVRIFHVSLQLEIYSASVWAARLFMPDMAALARLE